MTTAKHLLRCIAGTTEFSITYKKGGFVVTGFLHADKSNTLDNGESMSSYIMMMAKAPVRSESGKQSLTTMSMMEAAMVAAAPVMKETAFCSRKMTDLVFKDEFDNVSL